MTIFGVAGSVALLFVARIQSSCRRFLNAKDILSYELIVAKNECIKPRKQGTNQSSGKIRYQRLQATPSHLKGGRDKQTITMMVTDRTDFSLYFLYVLSSKESPLSLKKGVIIAVSQHN